MKAAVFHKPGVIEIEECGFPTIRPDEVLVRVEYCGICGSDIHLFEGKWRVQDDQVILGHEFSGVVEETGRCHHSRSRGPIALVQRIERR